MDNNIEAHLKGLRHTDESTKDILRCLDIRLHEAHAADRGPSKRGLMDAVTVLRTTALEFDRRNNPKAVQETVS